MHCAVGLLFVLAYQKLWKKGKIKKTWLADHFRLAEWCIGGIGLEGYAKAHQIPPWMDFTNFFVQLVSAHIVFAVCATLTSRLLDEGVKGN